MKKKQNICDVGNWLYSDIVKDHFFKPRNILFDETDYEYDGMGISGNAFCGDMMVVWIRVDDKKKKITECKWRTFGCASAIASTSMMSVMVTENGGMSLAKAKKLTPEAIVKRLGGLPDKKYHCSVLGDKALNQAILDYENNKKIK
jgi:NifU-like protein involved in Fe-S cluster formation